MHIGVIYISDGITAFALTADDNSLRQLRKSFFFGGLAAKMPEALAPVVASTGYLLVSWLFLYFLYKKRIFLKV